MGIDTGGGIGHGPKHRDKLLFAVGKQQFAFVPGARIEHLRQHQERPDRLQQTLVFERAEYYMSAAHQKIDLAYAGALFRHQARNLLAQAARSILHANFWKRSGKNLAIEHFLVTTAWAIDDELPFFLRCTERRFPVGFPISRRLSRDRIAARTYKPPACRHNLNGKPFCSFHRSPCHFLRAAARIALSRFACQLNWAAVKYADDNTHRTTRVECFSVDVLAITNYRVLQRGCSSPIAQRAPALASAASNCW